MLTKRIIPCLDIKNGRTVKGTNFENLQDAGDPVELAKKYVEEGADELVFLDITATNEKRETLSKLVQKVAQAINIPFTVGGGIKSLAEVDTLLKSGADKVSLNSAAVKNPDLIRQVSDKYGTQCVVVAIDTKFELENHDWLVYINAGQLKTNWKTLDWAIECQRLGAGEILLTSMDRDGTKSGFAVDITKILGQHLSIPVIASGGAGTILDFVEIFDQGQADAGLAASIFHYQQIGIPQLKKELAKQGIEVRV